MSELERRIQEAGRTIEPKIGAVETERALSKLVATEQRRTQRRTIAISSGVGAAIVAIAYFLARPAAVEPPAPVIAAAPGERAVHFSDGSLAILLSARTVIRVSESRDDLLEIDLEVGSARFDVVPNKARLFRVVTNDLRVEVLGTSFTVADEDGKSSVSVHRGKVAVYAGDNRHELVAGMSFELDEEKATVAPSEPREPSEELIANDVVEEGPIQRAPERKRKRPSKRSRPVMAWRHLAQEGLFQEAYDAMGEDGSPSIDDVRGLMLAADVARLTGHPEEAVGYLRTVSTRHASEPQAVLAAFTLGRILERELSRPAEAAEAFATARGLGPDGSLAEDALAHEIDCWTKAKRPDRARAGAEHYLSTYPQGRRADRIRSMIGQE